MSNRKDEDKIVESVATAAKLAVSGYDVDKNGISRDLKLGPLSEGESIHVKGNKIETNKYSDLDIDDFGGASESHTKTVGLFSREEHHEKDQHFAGIIRSSEETHTKDTLTHNSEENTKYLKLGGGLFESEETTYKESGSGGHVQGRDVETSCCGLKASSSEQSYCCTSEACCGYRCSTNWCGERVSLRCDTVCCFRPICNLIDGVHCPNLDNLGNCVAPVSNFCEGILGHIDISRVGDCLRGVGGCLQAAGPIIREVCEMASDLMPRD
ncbi:MAG: hypothetical protein P1U74_10670 [Legionellaceae bacterium]|nr:hypothetical protein [Legionellaceae bacterium]